MSFAVNQMFLNTYAANRLNGQFGVQQANQNKMNMAANPMAASPAQMLQQEKQITFGSLQNWLLARCSEVAEKSLKEQQKKDIQSSFNYFA